MDRTTLRRAQMELDSNIANLARQLVSREDRLGPLISLEVQVTTLSQSRINRLISVGKILTWLLPMSTLVGNLSGRRMDSTSKLNIKSDSHTWTYTELGTLLGLVGSTAWGVKKGKDELKGKSGLQQTFIVAHYEKDTKRFLIYDLDPNEKPDNMDRVILKRVVDAVSNLKGTRSRPLKGDKVFLSEEDGRRYKEALIVRPTTVNNPVSVPKDWLSEVLPDTENSLEFFKTEKKWYEDLGVQPVHNQLVRNLTIPTRYL